MIHSQMLPLGLLVGTLNRTAVVKDMVTNSPYIEKYNNKTSTEYTDKVKDFTTEVRQNSNVKLSVKYI